MNEAAQAEASRLVTHYLAEAGRNHAENPLYYMTQVVEFPSVQAILDAELAVQVAVLGETLREEVYPRKNYMNNLRGRLLVRNLPLSPFEMEVLLVWAAPRGA